MKKKNGFTLIELLVTIALALSVLGIVIASTIVISNRRKQDAYKLVQEEVLTAAKRYFDSNEYLFEGLDDTAYGVITVGMLVENDYLNRVINPITGKQLNPCDQAVVSRAGGIYKAVYKEYDEYIKDGDTPVCANEAVTIAGVGSPEIKTRYYKANDLEQNPIKPSCGKYFNSSDLGESKLGIRVEAKIEDPNESENIKISLCDNYDCNNPIKTVQGTILLDTESFETDAEHKTIWYKAENVENKNIEPARASVSIGVDTVAPTITYTLKSPSNVSSTATTVNGGAWFKATRVDFDATITDETSGINTYQYYYNKANLSVSEAKSTSYKWNGSAYANGSSSSVRNGKGTKSATQSEYFSADGSRKITHVAEDMACNKATPAEYTINFDHTAPTYTVEMYKRTTSAPVDNPTSPTKLSSLGNNVWYSGWAYVQVDKDKIVDKYSGLGSSEYTLSGAEGSGTISGYRKNINNEGTTNIKYKICDKVGNCNEATRIVNLDRTPPKIRVFLMKRANSTDNNGVAGYNNHKSYTNDTKKEEYAYTSQICYKPNNCSTKMNVVCNNNDECEKTFERTGSSNSFVYASWFGNNSSLSNYAPYGFTIYMEDEEEDTERVHYYTNKANLTTAQATGNYKWDSTNKNYPGGSEGDLSKEGRYMASAKRWYAWLSGQGDRRVIFYFYDKANNVTGFQLVLKMDRTKPTMATPVKTCIKSSKTACTNSEGSCNDESDCYYSHKAVFSDDLSGVKSPIGYNHCWDSANSSTTALICSPGYTSSGAKSKTVKYTSYATRTVNNGTVHQNYKFSTGVSGYHLFYEIYDKAGNVAYYRYKLSYSPSGKTSSVTLIGKQ